MTEHFTCNPEAYDIPTYGSPLFRYRCMRIALLDELVKAGKDVQSIMIAQGEGIRIREDFPDGLMRFEVHFIEKA